MPLDHSATEVIVQHLASYHVTVSGTNGVEEIKGKEEGETRPLTERLLFWRFFVSTEHGKSVNKCASGRGCFSCLHMKELAVHKKVAVCRYLLRSHSRCCKHSSAF